MVWGKGPAGQRVAESDSKVWGTAFVPGHTGVSCRIKTEALPCLPSWPKAVFSSERGAPVF